MPTYKYFCENCENSFEIVHKMSDIPTSQCANCDDPKLSLIITGGANIFFKGGGWSGHGLSTPDHVKLDLKNGRRRKPKKKTI